MTPGPTPEQVAAQVALIRGQRPEARAIAISTPGPWSGGATLRIDGDTLPVTFCASALQISEVLASQASDSPPLVIVTPLDEGQLSLDVLARLAGRHLYRIDRWQIVRDLFRARQIDPRLTPQGWIADALLQHIPEGGYSPVASGLLDADTAWTHILRQLGLPNGRPDAVALLRWSLCQQNLQRYAAWPQECREALRQRVETTTGALGVALLDALDAGYGALLLPIGLACEILFSDDGRQHMGIAQSRARLEPYMAGRMLTLTSAAPGIRLRPRSSQACLKQRLWTGLSGLSKCSLTSGLTHTATSALSCPAASTSDWPSLLRMYKTSCVAQYRLIGSKPASRVSVVIVSRNGRLSAYVGSRWPCAWRATWRWRRQRADLPLSYRRA
jgi:hypothetical protein